MSRLRGEAWDRCTLPWAAGALGESTRQVARPQTLWLAGLGYQFLSFGFTFGLAVSAPLVGRLSPDLTSAVWWRGLTENNLVGLLATAPGRVLLTLPLFLVFFRLTPGMARLLAGWRDPMGRQRGLRAAWRGGRGLLGSTLYLWVQVLLMVLVATVAFLLPAQLLLRMLGLDGWGPTAAVVSGTTLLLTLGYGFLLAVVFQLALQSLVANRRGVGSALLHAWRLARNDPAATARATAMDAVLLTTAVTGQLGLTLAGRASPWLPAFFVLIVGLALEGLMGCIRCAYWSRAYRALGGLETGVESLPAPPATAQ